MAVTRPRVWLRLCTLILTILLEYSVGQSITKLTAESQVAIEGQDSTTLPCYYIPTDAVIGKYYWKKNETVIARKDDLDASRYSLTDPKQVDTAGYVSLSINTVSRQDTDSYTCGVNDQSTGATILFQKKCSLTVYYLDTPTLNSLGDLEAVRGSKVSMSCNSKDAFPKLITRKWFHGNKILKEIPGKINFKNDILEIETFDESNKGNYSCKVENESELGKNIKKSNSITYRLKDEVTAPPSTSSSGAIIATFVILAFVVIVILGVVYVIYSRKKKQRDIYTIIETITNNKESHKLIHYLIDTPGDFKEKYDIQPVKVNKDLVKDEPIKFIIGEIVVPRGSDVAAPFKLTYTDKLLDIINTSGFKEPCFDFILKPNKEKQDKTKIYQPNMSLDYVSKISKDVKIAEVAKGSLKSSSATDDDEGRFGCFLDVKQESKQSGTKPTTRFRFGGELSIRLTNAIHRNTNGRLFSTGGLVLNNRAFLLLNDNKKYIMCKGIPDTTQASPITWDEDANVLIQTEREFQLLSYAALPGIRSPYILVGVINVSENKIKRRLVTVLPNRNPSFIIMDEIIKTLELNGSVKDLKFDHLSGRKLSSGRLVVGGWVKRKAKTEENDRPGMNESRVKYLPLSSRKQADVENQSFSYQPFIMWTDNEIDWKMVYLDMDNAEDNMRIQLIETDISKVRVIISLLQSSMVLYEGVSEDNCATFKEAEEKSTTYMPVVSVALSDGMFVYAPTLSKTDDDSNHKHAAASATKPLDTEKIKGTIAGLSNSFFGKLCAKGQTQSQKESQDSVGGKEDDNLNAGVPSKTVNNEEVSNTDAEHKTTTAEPKKRGKGKKKLLQKALPINKTKQSSSTDYESVSTIDETPKRAAEEEEEREETEVTEIDKEDIQGTSQQEPDESTPCVHEEDEEERVKKRGFKQIFKKNKSKEKTKNKNRSKEQELPPNQEREKLNQSTTKKEKKKKEIEGLWHFIEDTSDNRVIRLKPIHVSVKDYKPIHILQNKSKVKCEQIVPFMNEGKSWFLMIYTTNFKEDEDKKDRGHCIRYHVFSLDVLKVGIVLNN